jgi:hypothetical protein
MALYTIPVELVYRILDNLDTLTIVLSCRNVCTRLNAITDSYCRYKVKSFDEEIEAIDAQLFIYSPSKEFRFIFSNFPFFFIETDHHEFRV